MSARAANSIAHCRPTQQPFRRSRFAPHHILNVIGGGRTLIETQLAGSAGRAAERHDLCSLP
jgi:hypothetical protein